MDTGQIIMIFMGLFMLLFAIGLAFVKVDNEAYMKDQRRFGPLSIYNMGFGYFLLRNQLFRWLTFILFIGLGLLFICTGFGYIL